IWRSEQPVSSVTVITAAGMRRLVDGKEVQRLASSRIPAFAHLYEVIDRAMMGDWSALQQDFAVESTGDRHAWRVVLTPLRAGGPLAARLASVVLTGGARIDTVDINRANGDFEHVAFLNQVVSNTPPADPDANLLHDKWE
ncbi:MAG: LolA-related protein, partial [Candidatus Binataceae bacterium]